MARSAIWQFTINTRGGEELAELDLQLGSKILYYKYQLEKGELGTEHWQGCVRFKTNVTLGGAKLALGVPHAHMEPAKDWEKLRIYCGKEETRVRGPYERGDPGTQGKRSDLLAVWEAVKAGAELGEIAGRYPGQWIKFHKGITSLKLALQKARPRPEVTVTCFYGETGCGKTRKVMEMEKQIYTVFCMKTPWFDGYDGEEAMLLDDFGPGMMNINFLKRLLDRYAMTLPVKGGSIAMNAKRIYITTNYMMSEWYPKAGKMDFDALARRITWVNFSDIESRGAWEAKLPHRETSRTTIILSDDEESEPTSGPDECQRLPKRRCLDLT